MCKFSVWKLVKLFCAAALGGRKEEKVQRDGEKVDKEAKETERATGEMEMDGEIQKMRQRQSRSAVVNICQSLP